MSESQRDINVRIRAVNETQAAYQQATQGTRTFKAEVDQTTVQVAAFRDRLRDLRAQHDLGQISATKYANSLKTLRADMAGMAATTTLSARAQRDLGQVSAMAESQITGMGRGMRRSKDGIEGVAIAASGMAMAARGSVGALSGVFSSLQMVAISNPYLVGILGGLSAIAAAYSAIEGSAKGAADAQEAAAEAAHGAYANLRVSGPERTDQQKSREATRLRLERVADLAKLGAPRQAERVYAWGGSYRTKPLSDADRAYNTTLAADRQRLTAEVNELSAIVAANRAAIAGNRAKAAAEARAREDARFQARAGRDASGVGSSGYTPALTRLPRDLEWAFLDRANQPSAAEQAKRAHDQATGAVGGLLKPDGSMMMPPGFLDAMNVQCAGMRANWQMIRAEMKETQELAVAFGAAWTDVMGAMGSAIAEHKSVTQAMLAETGKAIAREMQIQAKKQVAYALADAAAGMWGSAALHMLAASAFGVAGGFVGSIGGSSASRSSPAGNSGSSSSTPQTVVIQILGQTTGQVVQETTYDLARYRALGGRAPGTSVVHLPVTGVVVVGAG